MKWEDLSFKLKKQAWKESGLSYLEAKLVFNELPKYEDGKQSEVKEHSPGQVAPDWAYWVPVLGDALDVVDTKRAVERKDYTAAGIGLGMLALPNIIEKPVKALYKYVKPFVKTAKNKLSAPLTVYKEVLSGYDGKLSNMLPITKLLKLAADKFQESNMLAAEYDFYRYLNNPNANIRAFEALAEIPTGMLSNKQLLDEISYKTSLKYKMKSIKSFENSVIPHGSYLVDTKGNTLGTYYPEAGTLRGHTIAIARTVPYTPVRWNLSQIKDTMTHELSHALTNRGVFANFSELITEYDPISKYYTSNKNTNVGKAFADVLRHESGWESSPDEMIAETMSQKLKEIRYRTKHLGEDYDEAVKYVNTPEYLLKLVYSKNSNLVKEGFFKPDKLEDAKELLKKYVPAVMLGGYGLNRYTSQTNKNTEQ